VKRCPYCAEWIQDEAVKCRYCQSDLAAAEGSSVPAEPSRPLASDSESPPSGAESRSPEARPGEGAVRFSHSGFRYVLGYGRDFFGIWGRDQPGQPVERYPRTDQGWAQAWNRFNAMEPQAVEVPEQPSSAGPAPIAAPQDAMAPVAETSPAPPPEASHAGARIGEGALRFSHSGTRYILGYGQDFFGIWDRETPGGPIMRFPRTDEGWSMAWNRFTAWEPKAIEVPLTGTAPPDVRVSTGTFRSGRTRATWAVWLLGIIAALTVVGFSFRLMELDLLKRQQRGELISRSEAEANDNRGAAIDLAIGAVAIGTIVAWCMWQHRSHANVRALGTADVKFTPRWAVGWWFIPIANVVQPFRAMSELWKASDPEAGAVDWKGKTSTVLLAIWWAAWLLRVYVFPSLAFNATGAFSTAGEHPSVADLIARDRYILGGDAATILAAVLAIMLVRRITARLEAKHQRMSAWTGSFPQAG
jgi:hypothetical protein